MKAQSLKSFYMASTLLAGAGILSVSGTMAGAALPADYMITNATVYDGSDQPSRVEDVVIAGDKIVYVGYGAAKKYAAKKTFDGTGKILSPGFIDGHSHPDRWVESTDPVMREQIPWITQGETTLVYGVEGSGRLDIANEKAQFAKSGIGTNLLPLVGYKLLRGQGGILGFDDKQPTPADMDKAKKLFRQGMCEGGWGFSISLYNTPHYYAKTPEVVEIAKEVAKYGGIFHTHQRDEASYTVGLLGATAESIDIGRQAKIPVQITHYKAIGPDVWGKGILEANMMTKARAEGVDVWADQYPWPAASAGILDMVFNRWTTEGGREAMLRRINDPKNHPKLLAEGTDNIRRRGGPESLIMNAKGEEWTGKSIGAMAKLWGVTPVDAVIRMVNHDATGLGVISMSLNEKDIAAMMQQTWVTSSSDAGANHPRLYSSYPRKYEKYAIHDHTISVQEFIRSSTGREADYLNLDRRGYIREGYFADVVVFDPNNFKQHNDFVNFDIRSTGIKELFVNGVLEVQDDNPTGARGGQVVLHKPISGSCD